VHIPVPLIMSWMLFAHISLTQIAHAHQYFYYLKKYLNETNIKEKSGRLCWCG